MSSLCDSIISKGKNSGQACCFYASNNASKCFYHIQPKNFCDTEDDVCHICHEGTMNFQTSCCKVWYHIACLKNLQKSNSDSAGKCPTCRARLNMDRNTKEYTVHNFKCQQKQFIFFDEKKMLKDQIKDRYHESMEAIRFEEEKLQAKKIACQKEFDDDMKTIQKIEETFSKYTEQQKQLAVLASIPNLDVSLASAGLNMISGIKQNVLSQFSIEKRQASLHQFPRSRSPRPGSHSEYASSADVEGGEWGEEPIGISWSE